MHFKLIGQAKSRLIHLKTNTEGIQQLRGFAYEFEVSMPPAVSEFCYYAGFGEFPHLGFGYVDLK
jgi:CRISPR/Cas system endoribonuclease Cas6 (RAMP superfamily)